MYMIIFVITYHADFLSLNGWFTSLSAMLHYVPWQPSLVPNFELSAYLMKVIPETHCVH